jgi:hypothetical protein
VRSALLVAVAATGLGGCLGGDPPAVHGELAPGGTTTRAERFVLRGTVHPAASDVRLLDGATRQQSAVARRDGAAFAFALEHLAPGASRYVVEATHPRRAPWRRVVTIVRRAPAAPVPRRVTVPVADPSPARAELRLDRRRLVAVAIGRDAGGMARIRVSAELRLRCRAADGRVERVGLVHHDPPPAVARVRVPAGARVPGVLRRRADLRAAARARCAESDSALAGVTGVVWAEATNAHGRDRYSASVPLDR